MSDMPTQAQAEWLYELSAIGPQHRAGSNVGFNCMRNGWTEWDYRFPDGREATVQELQAEYGEKWWVIAGKDVKDRITEKGIAALRRYRLR